MKRPKEPKQPKKPYKPIEPKKILPSSSKFIKSLNIRTYNPYTINSLMEEIKPAADELGIDVGECELRFEIEPGHYGDPDYISLNIYCTSETNNLDYDNQYKDYLKKLAKYEKDIEAFGPKEKQYKADLKEYKTQLKLWELESARETIKKLEKELNK